MKKLYSCSALDFSCPYYEQGFCNLENPKEECDEFFFEFEEEEEE